MWVLTLASEDENSAAEFNAVTEFLLRLKARGVATMLVHHANKGGDNFRGSSKLAATFETIVKLEKPEGAAGEDDTDDARFRVVRLGERVKSSKAVLRSSPCG